MSSLWLRFLKTFLGKYYFSVNHLLVLYRNEYRFEIKSCIFDKKHFVEENRNGDFVICWVWGLLFILYFFSSSLLIQMKRQLLYSHNKNGKSMRWKSRIYEREKFWMWRIRNYLLQINVIFTFDSEKRFNHWKNTINLTKYS